MLNRHVHPAEARLHSGETTHVKLVSWIGLAAAAAFLAACGRHSDTPPPAPVAAVEKPGPVAWNAASGGFDLAGRPLKAVKLWTFDGSTDGFTGGRSKVAPAPGQGLSLALVDPSLRSPTGLNVPGGQFSLVIVRITRTGVGAGWDGALYYATAAHPESASFLAKPEGGAQPGLNETVTLVYDMSRLAAGGGDWLASNIDQLRFDIEDKPGGQFVIHQIAIAENPNAAPPPKAEAAAEPPAASATAAKPPPAPKP